MAYTYAAGVQITDSDGRFLNLTQTPTLYADNFRTGVALAGTPTITNIRTGVYRVQVDDDSLIDVIFSIVPHVDDQSAVADVAVMEVKTYHEVAGILTEVENPDQYKADISTLALEATLDAIKGEGWTNETLVEIKTVVDLISSGSLTAQEIWEYTSRSLTELFGLDDRNELSNFIWNYVRRKLGNSSPISEETDNQISCIKGDTLDIDLTDIDLTEYTSAFFTVKEFYKNSDSESLLQISSGSGLLYYEGIEASGSSAYGSLTLDAPNETVTVFVKPEITSQLSYSPNNYLYDLQLIKDDGTTYTVERGVFYLLRDITNRLS